MEIRTLRKITKYVFPHNTSISVPDYDIFTIMLVTIIEPLAAPITLSNSIWQWNQFILKDRHAWALLHLLRNKALEWYHHSWRDALCWDRKQVMLYLVSWYRLHKRLQMWKCSIINLWIWLRKRDSWLICWHWVFTSIFLKTLAMVILCLVGSFLCFCCGIFSYFVFFYAFLFCWKVGLNCCRQNFFRHCFDAFSEPPQSKPTKYSIRMPQKLNGCKNCTKEKFYTYRLKRLYFCQLELQ